MRILSGIRATGALHIGNYLGAIQQWIELQKKSTAFYMIADLHAITTPFDPKTLAQDVRVVAAEYLAAGLDPKKATLFVQSQVPAHAELMWILNAITPFGELRRMTQWKDKTKGSVNFDSFDNILNRGFTEFIKKTSKARFPENRGISEGFRGSPEFDEVKKSILQNIDDQLLGNTLAGLLSYPVLMAADILLYNADRVPVGEDQVQHVELARTLARKFNKQFGKTLIEPQSLLTEGKRVLSLRDPNKKMSKTNDEPLYLSDEPAVIQAKLARAVTATSGGGKNPGVENLLVLLRAFAPAATAKKFEAAEKDGSIRYSELKQTLATVIADHFADFRATRRKLLANPKSIDKVLADGAKKATKVASETLARVYDATGLR